MLKRDKNNLIIFFVFFLYTCSIDNNKKTMEFEDNILKKTISTIGGKKDYEILYNTMSDTLNSWVFNNILSDSVKSELDNNSIIITKYQIDSTFVINSYKDKIIGSLFQVSKKNKNSYAHGIHGFYGAKIEKKWFFWFSGYTPIFKNSNERYTSTPFSYKQLHQMSIGSLGGYLDKNGNIRDKWFEAKFKSGRTPFKDRYRYKWTLNGKKIDNEEDYWNYSYWKSGTKLWADKHYNDSIENLKKLKEDENL